MNILRALQADHRRFLALIEELEDQIYDSEKKHYTEGFSGEAGRAVAKILAELLPGLRRHEEIEETLLFPELLRRAPEAGQALETMAQEHGSLYGLLDRFAKGFPQSPPSSMTQIVLDLIGLTNILESHILREEMGLYAMAEKRIPVADLERLSEQADRMRTSV